MSKTPLAPDDLKVGMLVTVYAYKPREAFCLQCHETHQVTPPNNEYSGEPFRVTAVAFPFISVVYIGTKIGPTGTTLHFDNRYTSLMEIPAQYARAAGGIIPKRVRNKNASRVVASRVVNPAPVEETVSAMDSAKKLFDHFLGEGNYTLIPPAELSNSVVAEIEENSNHKNVQPPEFD